VQENDVRDEKVNISHAVEQFREDVESRSSFLPRSHHNQRMPDGCDLEVYSVPYKRLPDAVFESLGGKKAAHEIRKARRAAKEPKAKKKGKKDGEGDGDGGGGGIAAAGGGEEEGKEAAVATVEGEEGPPTKKTKANDATAVVPGGGAVVETDGRTALHTAAMLGNLEQVQGILSEASSQLNAIDGGGKTPLDLAILHGKLDVVDFLREAGGLAPMEAARVARFNIDEDARKSKLSRALSTKEAEYDFVGDEEVKEEEKPGVGGEGGDVATGGEEGEEGEGVVEVEGVVRTHVDLIHFAPFVPKWRRPSKLPRARPIKLPINFTWATGV